MQNKIIQAIKNFDTKSLYDLLDDDKPYMDVKKAKFIKALNKSFQSAKENGCHSFDDVFFGICGQCNKGCEGMTFFSNTGHFLDLYIESKREESVDDIYVCNKLTNFTDLEKRYDLSFHFCKDEEVKFIPNKEYIRLRDQLNLMKAEFKQLEDKISLDQFGTWYDKFLYLRNHINNLDIFDLFEYKLYVHAEKVISTLDNIINIKLKAQHVFDALIDFQLATTERDQLIWFLENEQDQYSSLYLTRTENPNMVMFKSNKLALNIDISGYEYVMDYFQKVDRVYEKLMEKYAPLLEHYEQSASGSVEYSLASYLKLHNKYLDVLEKFNIKC